MDHKHIGNTIDYKTRKLLLGNRRLPLSNPVIWRSKLSSYAKVKSTETDNSTTLTPNWSTTATSLSDRGRCGRGNRSK